MSLAMDKSRKAVEELKAAILSGKFSSGNFPSIAMIMARFGLARATAVKVRDELKSQRLIVGKVGKGTFITRRAMSRKIGLIVPSIIGSEFFPVVVSETAKVIRENGYTLQFADFQLCASSAGLGDEVMAFVDGLIKDKVCGVIFQPLEFQPDAAEWNQKVLDRLVQARIPHVLLICDLDASGARSDCDLVGIDNIRAGRRLAEHLLSVGARRIEFVTRPNSGPAFMDRQYGIRSAVLERGGRFSVFRAEPDDVPAFRRHLKRGRPEAIVCGSDTQAGIFRKTLETLGLAVPKDILLAGFNDLQIARILTPPLTTIHQPCRDLARVAFDTLMQRIEHPDRPAVAHLLDAPLVVRESTRSGGGNRISLHKTKRKTR